MALSRRKLCFFQHSLARECELRLGSERLTATRCRPVPTLYLSFSLFFFFVLLPAFPPSPRLLSAPSALCRGACPSCSLLLCLLSAARIEFSLGMRVSRGVNYTLNHSRPFFWDLFVSSARTRTVGRGKRSRCARSVKCEVRRAEWRDSGHRYGRNECRYVLRLIDAMWISSSPPSRSRCEEWSIQRARWTLSRESGRINYNQSLDARLVADGPDWSPRLIRLRNRDFEATRSRQLAPLSRRLRSWLGKPLTRGRRSGFRADIVVVEARARVRWLMRGG